MTVAAENIHEAKQVERVLKEGRQELDKLPEIEMHEDRTRELKTPAFRRMRTDWDSEDHAIVLGVDRILDRRLMLEFPDLFVTLEKLFNVVRQPAVGPGGVIKTDVHGLTVWAVTDDGDYVEDWSRLGTKDAEDFLFRITTRMVAWSQISESAWTEAMLSKGKWEEAFAQGFNQDPEKRLTIDDRTQRARSFSADERYFSVVLSSYSRKCQALLKDMERISLRLSQRVSG